MRKLCHESDPPHRLPVGMTDLVRSDLRITGFTVGEEGFTILTSADEWCDGEGSGLFRGASPEDAVRKYRREVGPAPLSGMIVVRIPPAMMPEVVDAMRRTPVAPEVSDELVPLLDLIVASSNAVGVRQFIVPMSVELAREIRQAIATAHRAAKAAIGISGKGERRDAGLGRLVGELDARISEEEVKDAL